VRTGGLAGKARTRLVHDLVRLCASLFIHFRPRDLLEESEAVRILLVGEVCDLRGRAREADRQYDADRIEHPGRTHSSLGHDVVRVGAREAGRLEERHDLSLGRRLAVELILVLLETDRASQQESGLVCSARNAGELVQERGARGRGREVARADALVGNRPSELSNSISTYALIVAPPAPPPPSCRSAWRSSRESEV